MFAEDAHIYKVAFSQVSNEIIICASVGFKPLVSFLASTWSLEGTGKLREGFTNEATNASFVQLWVMTSCAQNLSLIGSYWQHSVGWRHNWVKHDWKLLRAESLREPLCISLERHHDPCPYVQLLSYSCLRDRTADSNLQILPGSRSSRFWVWNEFDPGITGRALLCTRLSTHIWANKKVTATQVQARPQLRECNYTSQS